MVNLCLLPKAILSNTFVPVLQSFKDGFNCRQVTLIIAGYAKGFKYLLYVEVLQFGTDSINLVQLIAV